MWELPQKWESEEGDESMAKFMEERKQEEPPSNTQEPVEQMEVMTSESPKTFESEPPKPKPDRLNRLQAE